MEQPLFSLGVNYWPVNKAMYWWKEFDVREVEEEFAQIHDFGFHVVRIFLLWEDFQPEPAAMNADAMLNLGKVLDIAQRFGLKVQPTFFTGHMSGYNWAPHWLLKTDDDPAADSTFPLVAGGQRSRKKMRNIYSDPRALRAQVFQIKEIINAFRQHPAIYGWDLGNEPDVFQLPETRHDQWLWHTLMITRMKELDPDHVAVCGTHSWSLKQNTLRPDDFAQVGDFAIMHGYSIYDDAARHPMDSDIVPFSAVLTEHLAGKKVLFQEFGVCTTPPGENSRSEKIELPHRTWDQYVASEDEAAIYFAEVLEKLWRVGALGAWVWCFADYGKALWNRPPCDLLKHERTFGMVRDDHTPKKHAQVIKEFAAEKRRINANPPYSKLAITPDQYYEDPAGNYAKLFREWV